MDRPVVWVWALGLEEPLEPRQDGAPLMASWRHGLP